MAHFISYAQNCEDVMLWRALKLEIAPDQAGFYIDIGAGDPLRDSVTYAFYERGWRGLNIEPNPKLYSRLLAERPEDTNLNLAVGIGGPEIILHVVEDDDRVSTTDGELAAQYNQSGRFAEGIAVPCRTLEEILDQHARKPIHFLKIDVEGAEADVLRHANFKTWRPWIIIIEALHPITLLPTQAAWEEILLSAGYHFVYFDGLNRFYVADEKASKLDGAFAAPPSVLDGHVRSQEATAMRLQEIERTHADVVAELHRDIYALRAERDACIESRHETEIALHNIEAELVQKSSRTEALVEEMQDILQQKVRQTEKIECLTIERDSWMQEMFETNRHVAYLAQERQNLLEQYGSLPAHVEAQDALLQARLQEIERLESHAAAQDVLLQARFQEIERLESHAQAQEVLLQARFQEIERLESHAQAQDALLQARFQEIERLESHAQAREVLLQARMQDINSLQHNAIQSEQQNKRLIADLHGSASWRFTKPLRKMSHLFTGSR